jgi:type IV pilus assembly protein PilP
LFFLVTLLFPAGVTYAGKKGAAPKKEAQKKKPVSIDEYRKRLEKLFEPVSYHYVASGKPDPFRPFLQAEMAKVAKRTAPGKKPSKPDHCDTPLECMDVGQLRLVGVVVEGDGQAVAMAQDASGIGYTLRLGTKIGFNNGVVTTISRDRVIVREKIKDLKGNPTFRERILYFHPEEGDESR